jgi:hypothetical protein
MSTKTIHTFVLYFVALKNKKYKNLKKIKQKFKFFFKNLKKKQKKTENNPLYLT